VLDARHLWGGDYHPALVLKAAIEKLEGANEELRDQVRKYRLDEEKTLVHLEKYKERCEDLKRELDSYKEVEDDEPPPMIPVQVPQTPRDAKNSLTLTIGGSRNASVVSPSVGGVPFGFPAGSAAADQVAKLNSHMIQVLDQYKAKEADNRRMREELDRLHLSLSSCRHQMGLLYEDFALERSKWAEEMKEEQASKDRAEEKAEVEEVKVKALEEHLQSLVQNGAPPSRELGAKLASTARECALLRSRQAMLTRRHRALQHSEGAAREEVSKLKEEIVAVENAAMERLGALQRYKDRSSFKMEALQKQLTECVPMAELEEANRQYAEMAANYREVMQREQDNAIRERREEELELSLESMRGERDALKEELKSAKEKVHSLDSLLITSTSSSGGNDQEQRVAVLCKEVSQIRPLTDQNDHFLVGHGRITRAQREIQG